MPAASNNPVMPLNKNLNASAETWMDLLVCLGILPCLMSVFPLEEWVAWKAADVVVYLLWVYLCWYLGRQILPKLFTAGKGRLWSGVALLFLTNWQTFWKNVALDVPTVYIFLTRNMRLKRRFERDGLIFIFAVAAMLVFEIYNIKHEPVIDFRPWKIGNKMMDLESTEGMKSYVTYRNTKTGESEEFESAQLMEKLSDSEWAAEWEWESSRVVDPREIAAPGFSMLDLEGEDRAIC